MQPFGQIGFPIRSRDCRTNGRAGSYGRTASAFSKIVEHSLIRTTSGTSLMAQLTYHQRKQTIAGYDQLIEEIIEHDKAQAYYVNFMFNQLPGSDRTRREIMIREVTRFHDILTNH